MFCMMRFERIFFNLFFWYVYPHPGYLTLNTWGVVPELGPGEWASLSTNGKGPDTASETDGGQFDSSEYSGSYWGDLW